VIKGKNTRQKPRIKESVFSCFRCSTTLGRRWSESLKGGDAIRDGDGETMVAVSPQMRDGFAK
jgi:hypothetical protein